MEVGLIGRKMMGWDLSQGIIAFELSDDKFDTGPIIVKAPEIQGL